MRFVLVIAIWCVCIGGLWGYTQLKNYQRLALTRVEPVVQEAVKKYSVGITPTFSLEKDPFAFVDEESEGKSIELWLNGKEIEVDENGFSQGVTSYFHEVDGVLKGPNEIFVKASPPVDSEMSSYGIRLQVIEDGVSVVDETVWSAEGALVTGSYIFSTGEEKHDEEHH